MIPVLYSQSESDYGHNGIGILSDVIHYTVTEEANGEFELYLEYPVNGRLFQELKYQRLIKAKPNDVDEDHVFRIYEIVKDLESHMVYIYATSKTNDLGTNLVKTLDIKSKTAQEALNLLKTSLVEPTPFNFVSDITTRSSTYWEFRNPLNCIVGEDNSLVKYWGGEVKRTNDTVYLYSRRGRDNVTVLREGKNIKGLEFTVSTKGLVTKIVPYFIRYDEETGEEIITIGNTVSSPLVNNYPIVNIMPVDYTLWDELETAADLNAAASGYFTYQNPGVDKPKVSLDIDIMQLSESSQYKEYSNLESLIVFDSVTVYLPKFDVNVEVGVNRTVYNGLLERADTINCGDPIGSLFDDVRRDYTELIGSTESKLINIVQKAAEGSASIFRGPDEPVKGMKPGDLWYKPIGGSDKEMYQWTGAYWELILSTKDINTNKELVDDAVAMAEQAKQAAEQSYLDSVAEAERLVTAQTEAFDAEMTLRKGEITAVKNDIDAELARVDNAIIDNFASLSDTLDDVDAISNQAKADSQTAISNAQTAISNAQTAASNASTALSNAATALSNSQTAISTATSANNKSIKSSVIDWALSVSGTTPPTTGWSTTIPTPSTTQYTWGRTTITLNDGTTILSYNVSKIGVKGDTGAPGAGGAKGDKGDAGVNAPKITAVKQQFYLSSSDTSQTGGSWTDTIPVWSIGKYYWTRVVTSYENATTTQSVPVLDNSLNQSLVTALEAKSATQTLSTTVSQHATQIAAKAAQTTVDSLTGRVTTAEGTINVQAGQIALKANQTTVDSLTGRIGTAETSISANATAINLRATKSSVDTLTGRVTTAEGTITTQAGQIALRATTATVNTLTGRVSAAESSLSVQSGKIELAATKTELTTAIGDIQVGGRNLIRNSARVIELAVRNTGTGSDNYNYWGFTPTHLSMPMEVGVTYTFTGKIKKTAGTFNGVTIYPYPNGVSRYVTLGSDGRIEYTFTITDASTVNLYIYAGAAGATIGNSWEMTDYKLEKGNKATDWTPAPEDVDAAISSVQSNLTVEAGRIDLAATKTELTTAINGIEVGGVNLLRRLGELPDTMISNDGLPAKYVGISAMNYYIEVVPGKALTFSQYRSDYDGDNFFRYAYYNGNKVLVRRSARSDVEFTETVPSGAYFLRVSYQPNNKVKIERGTSKTAWTPAPEDVDAAISAVQSNLTVEAGRITALTTRVSGSETNISNVTQTVSGINTTISTLRTDVNGKATIVSLNSVKSTADGNKTTITNHSGRLTTVETTVSGLQTTVSNKADKTQITQLENSITSIVSKGTNSITNGDFTDGLNGWRVDAGSAMARTLINGEMVLSIGPSGTGVYLHGEDYGHVEDFYTFTIRAKGDLGGTALLYMGFLNLSSYYNTTFTLTSNWETYSFTTKYPVVATGNLRNFHVYSKIGNVGNIYIDWITLQRGSYASESQITQLSDLINLRVTKGDVVNQINISTESILIAGKKIQLDGDVTMTAAYTTRLNTQTLSAITANITSIRSQVLVTDSVTSTHVKAENALIDTIFGTTALITRLTSKTAFISNIQAINISADKITSGTLNSTIVNAISLNVSQVTGLNSSFIQSTWNGLNASVTLDSAGLRSISSRQETRLSAGIIRFYVDSADRGSILPLVNTSDATRHGIGMVAAVGSELVLGRYLSEGGVVGVLEIPRNTSQILAKGPIKYLDGDVETGSIYGNATSGLIISSVGSEIKFFQGGTSLMYGVAGGLRMYRTLNMNSQVVDNASAVFAGEVATPTVRNLTNLETSNILSFTRAGTIYSQMIAGGFRMHIQINMNTNNISGVGTLTYASDARYKSSIVTREVSDLDIIRNIRYVDYTFNKDGSRQRGLIAQELMNADSKLVTTSENGYLSYDSQQYTHAIGHGLQELDGNVRDLRDGVLRTNADFLSKIEELENKIQQLEEKLA